MPGLYSRYIKPIHALGDVTALVVSTIASYCLVSREFASFFSIWNLQLLTCSFIAWIICASLLETYKVYRVTRILRVIANALKVVFLYILLIEATLNILNVERYTREFLNYHYIIVTVLVVVWRIIVILTLRYIRRMGYNYRTVIIVGYSKAAIELKKFLNKRPEYGYRFLGIFDDYCQDELDVIGKVNAIEQFVLQNNVDEIYCCPYELQQDQVTKLLEFVDNNLVRMKFLPEPGGFLLKQMKVDFHDVLPVLIQRSIPLDDAVNKVSKRTFDIFFSLFVIVFILSWLLPLLAVFIRLDSKGTVFFKQERSGIDNKKFNCWKLRSMYVNSDANVQQARRGDARITPVGAFLRKTSLDELPQFFNVLMGQMSVVGPRPHMLKHTQEYSVLVDKFMVRHFIKPGITGLSQVRGLRGDTSEVHQMKARVKLDIFYIENWSLLLDIKIIFYTVYNVFRGDEHAF